MGCIRTWGGASAHGPGPSSASRASVRSGSTRPSDSGSDDRPNALATQGSDRAGHRMVTVSPPSKPRPCGDDALRRPSFFNCHRYCHQNCHRFRPPSTLRTVVEFASWGPRPAFAETLVALLPSGIERQTSKVRSDFRWAEAPTPDRNSGEGLQSRPQRCGSYHKQQNALPLDKTYSLAGYALT